MINLSELKKYYLNLSNINNYIENKKKSKKENKVKKKNKVKKENKCIKNVNKKLTITNKNKNNNNNNDFFYKINKKDTLFWCFYILENGFFSFETIKNFFIEMNNKRFYYIEKIKKNKDILKKYKFNIRKLEENLSNYNIMNIYTFTALCYVFNYNFCIFNNKICYNLNIFDNKIYCIKKINEKYGIYNNDDTIEYIKNNMDNKYIINNHSKPFKSVSGYKLKELQEIAIKLNIPIEKKKKSDLYSRIKEYF